jgi:hypothetical protein
MTCGPSNLGPLVDDNGVCAIGSVHGHPSTANWDEETLSSAQPGARVAMIEGCRGPGSGRNTPVSLLIVPLTSPRGTWPNTYQVRVVPIPVTVNVRTLAPGQNWTSARAAAPGPTRSAFRSMAVAVPAEVANGESVGTVTDHGAGDVPTGDIATVIS